MALTRVAHVRVDEPSQVGEARRAAATLSDALGADAELASRIALAVTELATNLVKHAAAGGDIALTLRPDEGRLDVLALDTGPGIPNVLAAMRDGFSTRGTVGSGLGAIERSADLFEVRSTRHGTVILARFASPSSPPPALSIGGACLAKTGESVSGDAWDYARARGHTRLLLADGLGHGPLAHEAAEAAADCFQETLDLPLAEAMQRLHAELRPTRGAAVALAEVDERSDTLRFLSVGNVAGQILSDGGRALVCTPGTVGHVMRKALPTDYPFPAGAALALHSDGVRGNAHLTDYPGLAAKDVALIAGTLLAERTRGTDDATVVVVRRRPDRQ